MKSRPQGKELYLIIFDVDHFKEINDKYGHIEGDTALVKMADAMRETCVGYARYDYDNPMTIPQFIAKADEKLYEMKKNR